MALIDHLSVGVASIGDATKFYDPLLATVGGNRLSTTDGFAAYGKEGVEFLVMLPYDKQASSGGNGAHICFVAPSREAVDSFHKTAMDEGGTCEGEPGPREAYPVPDAYAAYVRDPFGNKLEVIHSGFAG